jgi:hypothetical protein
MDTPHPSGWPSHKDQAAKALKKLAGPHLPASLSAAGRKSRLGLKES